MRCRIGKFFNPASTHDCQQTIEQGKGKPCPNCQEQALERQSKNEHNNYHQVSKRTQTLCQQDPEFQIIKNLFLRSTKKSKYDVIRIDKNGNPALLSRYEFAKDKHPNAKEKMLFHGTPRAENHRSIFDNGFKLEFARAGSLGRGIYFADDVDYSDQGYCFVTCLEGSNVRTILVCRVLLVNRKYKKLGNIQAVYDETLCLPSYIVYYR